MSSSYPNILRTTSLFNPRLGLSRMFRIVLCETTGAGPVECFYLGVRTAEIDFVVEALRAEPAVVASYAASDYSRAFRFSLKNPCCFQNQKVS